jgi:outer membrane immunogenic protein
MLRKILLSSVAFAAVSTAAFAADLPNRKVAPAAPYVAAPIFTWTGFYVGAQVGGGWTSDKMRGYNTATNVYGSYGKLNGSGVVGGLFAGYNWQMSNIVLGVEADIEATSIGPKSVAAYSPAGVLLPGAYSFSESLPWQGSLRARAGYAAGNALFYVTGGLAFGQINTKYTTIAGGSLGLTPAEAGSASFSSTQAGWTLGAGVEYAFNANWIARAEYRYTRFGGFTDSVAAGVPNAFWAGNL